MNKNKLGHFVLSGITVALLTACGGSDSNTAQPSTPTPTQGTTPEPTPPPSQVSSPILSTIGAELGAGTVFVSETGLSLYTFEDDVDVEGSACFDACATAWPPLLVGDGAEADSNWSMIERGEGVMQWALNGQPLYTYAEDSAAGDVNGDGLADGAWDLARPMPFKTGKIGDDDQFYTFMGNEGAVLVGGHASSTPLKWREDKAGFTLYFTDMDTPEWTNGCTSDGCLTAWPPLLADAGTKPKMPFSVIARGEGDNEEWQWAYRGKPLYFFANDEAPWEMKGNNAGATWEWHTATTEPAILRTIPLEGSDDTKTFLSATGMAKVLKPNGDDWVVEDVNMDGFALYVYKGEMAVDLAQWPAFMAADNVMAQGDFTKVAIEGVDGMQWSYKGWPLYFFKDDAKLKPAGFDKEGWSLIKPEMMVKTTFDQAYTAGDETQAAYITTSGYVSVLKREDADSDFMPVKMMKDGLPLYTLSSDDADMGKSICNEGCADAWPPLLTQGSDEAWGPYTKITRDDGNMQWAWNDWPLYYFANDTVAGDVKGDGLIGPSDGQWNLLLQPEAIPVTTNLMVKDDGYTTVKGQANVLVKNDEGEFVSKIQDKEYFTLYTFSNDMVGTSNCNGMCAENWPPLLASAADKVEADKGETDFTVISREDGMWQWTWKGWPLYFFNADEISGDMKGKDIANWNVAKLAKTSLMVNAADNKIVTQGSVSKLVNGEVVTADKSGFTLYTYGGDEVGTSNCTSAVCIENWPPLLVQAGDNSLEDKGFTKVDRGNDVWQWAWKGWPLYFFKGDVNKDDINGWDKVLNEKDWHIARTPFDTSIWKDTDKVTVTGNVHILTNTGPWVVDKSGFSLYTFSSDTESTSSACTSDGCKENWPALLVSGASETLAEPYGTIARDGGLWQITWNGWPLYFYKGDTSATDTNGSAVNNWNLLETDEVTGDTGGY